MKEYWDIPELPELSNGETAHPHRRVSDSEIHLHHRESDRRLAVLEAGQLTQVSALEAIGDRIVASVAENTRSTDQLRREVSGSLTMYLRYQLYLAIVGMIVAAGLAGASIAVRLGKLEVSSGHPAAVATPQPLEPAPTPTPDALKGKSP